LEKKSMDRSYPDRPIVGVGVVVFKAGDVLLIRRGKAPRKGEWSLPGGMQELGETVFQAGAREIEEETAISIGPPRLVDVIDAIRPDAAGRIESHYTLVDLTAPWQAGEPTAGSDAMAAAWIAYDSIRKLEMWPETYRVIDMAWKMQSEL
jgi:8-oxo-dGTP diphosphatase